MSMLFSQVAETYKIFNSTNKIEHKKENNKQQNQNEKNQNEKNIELIEKEEINDNNSKILTLNPEKIMLDMNNYATMNFNICVLNKQLKNSCSRLNAKISRYNTNSIKQAA